MVEITYKEKATGKIFSFADVLRLGAHGQVFHAGDSVEELWFHTELRMLLAEEDFKLRG